MKLDDIVVDQLDEIKLRHAVAAGMIAAAAMSHHHSKDPVEKVKTTQVDKKEEKKEKFASDVPTLVDIVTSNYHVQPAEALKIVKLTKKYETDTFKAVDLLSMIGIESSFDKHAVSSLKHDPAIGLTQIRPKLNGLSTSRLKNNIEEQIKHAVEILSTNYKKLGNKEQAFHAYNVGLTNVVNNENTNYEYVTRWKNELKKYELKT